MTFHLCAGSYRKEKGIWSLYECSNTVAYDEHYCKKHVYRASVHEDEQNGILHCRNFVSKCKATLPPGYGYKACDDCLEKENEVLAAAIAIQTAEREQGSALLTCVKCREAHPAEEYVAELIHETKTARRCKRCRGKLKEVDHRRRDRGSHGASEATREAGRQRYASNLEDAREYHRRHKYSRLTKTSTKTTAKSNVEALTRELSKEEQLAAINAGVFADIPTPMGRITVAAPIGDEEWHRGPRGAKKKKPVPLPVTVPTIIEEKAVTNTIDRTELDRARVKLEEARERQNKALSLPEHLFHTGTVHGANVPKSASREVMDADLAVIKAEMACKNNYYMGGPLPTEVTLLIPPRPRSKFGQKKESLVPPQLKVHQSLLPTPMLGMPISRPTAPFVTPVSQTISKPTPAVQRMQPDAEFRQVFHFGDPLDQETVRSLEAKVASYDQSARKRDLQWRLTTPQALSLFLKPCFYCGDEPFLDDFHGIDRVYSEMSYTPDNCVSCCTRCNISKGAFRPISFIANCARVAYFTDGIVEAVELFKRVPYDSDNGVPILGAKFSAKVRGIPFKLTDAQHKQLTESRCYLCGNFPLKRCGVDRVDSNQGYVWSNCRPCCANCNMMKHSESYHGFVDRCCKITHRFLNGVTIPSAPTGIGPERRRTAKAIRYPQGDQERRSRKRDRDE